MNDIEIKFIALLLNTENNIEIKELLLGINEEDFNNIFMRKVFLIIKDLVDKDNVVSLKKVIEILEKENIDVNTEEIKKIIFVDITKEDYTKLKIEFLEEIRNRKFKEKASDIVKKINNNEKFSINQFINDITLDNSLSIEKPLSLYELIQLKKKSEINPNEIIIQTGLSSLDTFIEGGFASGDLVVVAARPGMGKTAFALNLLSNIGNIQEKKVLFFSLEMTNASLVDRLIAIESELPLKDVRNSKDLSKKDREYLEIVYSSFEKAKIYFEERKNKIDEIESIALSMKPDVLIIDYLQLIRSDDYVRVREQEVANYTKSLKSLAKKLNIPIILLAQLSREVEKRSDKRPILSDLRESGSIEQDADTVLFLYRNDYYNKDNVKNEKQVVEIIVGKQRRGNTGVVECGFIPHLQKFTDEFEKTCDLEIEFIEE